MKYMDSYVLRVKESEYHKKYTLKTCFFAILIVKDDFKPTVVMFYISYVHL